MMAGKNWWNISIACQKVSVVVVVDRRDKAPPVTMQRGNDAVGTGTAATQRPEEIGVGGIVGDEELTVGGDYFPFEDVIC